MDNLRNIKNKILIILGNRNKAYNYDLVETLKIINCYSHDVHLEKPQEFNNCVSKFLN